MGLENIIGEALPEVLTTRLDSLINWARKSSLWPATFGLGLLCHRNDECHLFAQRPGPFWF